MTFFTRIFVEESEVLLPPGTSLRYERDTRLPLPEDLRQMLGRDTIVMRIYRCQACLDARGDAVRQLALVPKPPGCP